MKHYKLTRPFDDGTVVHPRGAIIALEKAPKSAKVITAKEIAANKAALSDAEDAVKSSDRAELKAELLAELLEAGGGNADTSKLEEELAAMKEALAEQSTKTDEALAEVEAANTAAAAAVTGGVDNDGKPLKTETTGKPPVQKAGGK